MSDYRQVTEALKEGADPAMLCMTCPWDRFCITPPAMTSEEVQAAMDKARDEDDAKLAQARAEGKDGGMPVGSLLAVLAVAGRDTQAQVCPVLAMRLRSSDGGEIVQQVRTMMKSAL